MHVYEQYEYIDMIRILHESDEDAAEAVRLYAHRFYARNRHPTIKVFKRLQDRIRENQPIVPQTSADAGRPRNFVNEDRILRFFRRHPTSSTRIASRHLRINHMTVHNALREDGLYPYHYTPVHRLEAADLPRRFDFCRWFRRRVQDEPGFQNNILWTDEAIFRQDGPYNMHNQHIYAHENPRCVFERNNQRRFKINVWCGMLNDQLIGPVFLPGAINGDVYLDLLGNLRELMEDVPLARRLNMIWQQDGAAPHRRQDVLNRLDHLFPRGWIGLNSDYQEWPPRSPDLTPLDFFLWGYLKDKVYARRVANEDELRRRIEVECARIPAAMILKATQRVATVVDRCIDEEGGHIEQFN